MNVANLPLESAVEPQEEARQPEVNKQVCNDVTFVESSTRIPRYIPTNENVLSQPPKHLTHKQKLLWLQQRRTEGLWAQCDDCDHWRYLPRVLDSHELPAKWYCWMNPDKTLATCSAPEVPICLYDEDDLIHAEYAAGSLVLARLPGFPWWPAMVCDCPDTEQYYWIDGFSDIPTHYNVVFFDAFEASRAWITPEQLMPYTNNGKVLNKSLKLKRYESRLNVAITQANDAEKLPLKARLEKYSFVARFNGKILTPKKIKRHEIERYRNMLKRKFNVTDFIDESPSSEDEVIDAEKKGNKKRGRGQKEEKKKIIKNKPKTKSNGTDTALIANTHDNLKSTEVLSSLEVQIDSASGFIKSTVTEDSNDNQDQPINTKESLMSPSVRSQDATDNTYFVEDSDKSDNFDF